MPFTSELPPASSSPLCGGYAGGWFHAATGKGTANYYDLVVQDQVNQQAAWYYADPKPAASNIKGYVAFWKGVKVND